jgi:hypothetical protein
MDDASEVERLANQRVWDGKQVYDWRTRQLRPEFPSEAFARRVLARATEIARTKKVKIKLSYLEKKLLRKAKIILF